MGFTCIKTDASGPCNSSQQKKAEKQFDRLICVPHWRKELAAMGVAEVVGSMQNPSLSLPLSGSHNINQGLTTGVSEPNSKPKKICCACPNTKRLRDECIVEHGEAACAKWIEAHLQCLRSEGFKV
ncbi:uncharacterized protein LOC131236719 [Magnolia sinica]|uniref:uncharacterized protein LOC131236719 n=1 Tax=Magnolia sinica TaxID=86752 RepID=UPI00265B6AD2|nr:uncharacterized protein LOC131236719 [Magnolia sinica]